LKKLLVVDDSQLICKVVEAYLKKRDWQVEVCPGPFGVLKKVADFQPSVVLLDIRMPGLNGQGVAKLLKNNKHKFEVVLFSSEPVDVMVDMVSNGLAWGYFVKGHTLDGLDMLLDRALSAQATL